METGTFLRAARLRAGLSQAELAARAGTSQAAIARRERGLEEPLVSTLRRLLYACGELLELTVHPLPPSRRRDRLQEERKQVFEILAANGAGNPRLFGSVAKGEDDETSDVDLLVDIAADGSVASELMTVLGLSEQLTALAGFRVDVASPATLRPEVLERALTEAVQL